MLHRLIRVLLLLCCALILSVPTNAQSALPRKLSDKPLAIFYSRSITQESAIEYFKDLSNRLNIGKSMLQMMEQQPLDDLTTKSEAPVFGQLVYLVQGFVPSMEWISFQAVVDEDEADVMLNSMAKRMGQNGRVEKNGTDFRLISSWDNEIPLTDDTKPEDYGFGQNIPSTPGFERKQEIVERDGKRILKMSQVYTRHYRYFDRLLYQSAYGDLADVELPTSAEIQAGFLAKSDAGIKLYADRVPEGIRTLAWNMLSATAGTQLQQRDSEDDLTWEMRNSAGQWGLATIRSALFDIDYGEGEGYLARREKPLRGRLQLRARRNSGLIKDLQDLSSGRSRFAPLLRDDAGATIHVCAALPHEGKEALTAAQRWLENAVQSAPATNDPAAMAALLQVLNDIAEDGTMEAVVRLAHSDASGSVILGGLQVGDRSDLPENIERVVRGEFGRHADVVVEKVQRHGRSLIHVHIPVNEAGIVRISDLWIAHRDDCLWIAAGGENAHEMIRIAAERCGASGRVVRGRLLTAKVDLDHWMSWPEDDPTKLSRLPLQLDRSDALNPMSWFMPSGIMGRETLESTSLLEKILAAERTEQKKAWLTLTTEKSGLLAEAEIGRALAEFFAARMLDFQDRIMQASLQAVEEAQAAAAAGLEATDDVEQSPSLPQPEPATTE